MQIDIDLLDSLLDRVETAASTSGGRLNIAKWIETETTDPINQHKQWSFKEHEFQLEIVNSQHPRTYVRKASQIGVSEIAIRIALALLVKLPGRHMIYTLPDANFAKKFTPSRFDPVIQASRKLKKMTSNEINNSEVKKVANSYLYIAGAQKESQSISTPASIMFNDEVAYSNQEVLGTFNSRLGHLKQGQEIVYGFSTPLLPGSDIDQLYQLGTQDQYMVYHLSCNQWVNPDPINDFIVPGLKVPVDMITKDDLKTINPKEAYIQCPHCKQKIDLDNLSNPKLRAWVPTYKDRYARSFDAHFLVLPNIRTPEKVLLDRNNYRSTGKWINFVIGRPAESSEDRITTEAINRAFDNIKETKPTSAPYVLGMDVGKIAHLTVGKLINNQLHIVHTEMPRQNPENYLATRFAEVYRKFNSFEGVIDAGPEFTVATKAQTLVPKVWGCYFTRGSSKSDLTFYEEKEERGVVMVQRTKAFDEFVAQFNKGDIKICYDENEKIIRDHLPNLARVTDFDNLGDENARWVSTGPDHFLFSMFYCWIASQMVKETMSAVAIPSHIARKARMKS